MQIGHTMSKQISTKWTTEWVWHYVYIYYTLTHTHTPKKNVAEQNIFLCLYLCAFLFLGIHLFLRCVCMSFLVIIAANANWVKKKLRKVHKETRISCFIFFLSKSTARAKFLMRMLCRHWMRILNDRNKFETIFRFMEMSVRAFKYVKSYSWQTNRYSIDMTPNGHRQRQEATRQTMTPNWMPYAWFDA